MRRSTDRSRCGLSHQIRRYVRAHCRGTGRVFLSVLGACRRQARWHDPCQADGSRSGTGWRDDVLCGTHRSADARPVELIAAARLGRIQGPVKRIVTRTDHTPRRPDLKLRTRTRTGNTGRFCKRYSAVSLASSGQSSGCHSKPVMTSVIESG